ncbi:Prolyl 4-hydroxylase [Thalictrum thalictroides]|uniref:procollagen-proline 4-dioxygenase n=1 Tax=Thalictrum thalictroides TaxID=46969 RepID=A0A7J6VYI7_THATH|nr:Prolyl 4-hydroxylase [Thalictrum thalictroides]
MENDRRLLRHVLIQSPELGIPTQFLSINPNSTTTLLNLKLSLLPPFPSQTLINSLYFTSNGKPLHDSSTLLNNNNNNHLTLRIKAFGGGGDGGATGAESRDCYLNMYAVKKPDKVDPNETRLSKWTTCALSYEPLKPPCVIDRLGNVFNKDSLVEGLLAKKLPKEFAKHIKGLKDMFEIHLEKIPGNGEDEECRFQCPITGLQFNGKYKFFALRSCGHVLSAKALKEVKQGKNSLGCIVCGREFNEDLDKIVVNGSAEEVAGGALLNGGSTKRGKEDAAAAVENVVNNGAAKRCKSAAVPPPNATKEVYASIFTSSRKSDFKETNDLYHITNEGASYNSNVVDPSRVTQISWHPRAFLYKNFLTDEECDHLISLSMGKLRKSMVIDSENGTSVPSKYRTSSGFFLLQEDEVATRISARIAAWTFLPPDHAEAFHILRYNRGEKYDPHYDFFVDNMHTRNAGQRYATVLMYLSNVEKGGETIFPYSEAKLDQPKDETWSDCAKSGYAVKPRKGDALLFFSLHINTSTDPDSTHGSCPVIKGEKWSATRWIHVKSFDLHTEEHLAAEGCVDENVNCPQWAASGECEKNPLYMIGSDEKYGYCRMSCQEKLCVSIIERHCMSISCAGENLHRFQGGVV